MTKILSWNTQGSKEALETLLEEAEFDLLAIQEPWINPFTKSTYCPRSSRFHLVHKPGSRVALYVTKRYGVNQWDYGAEDLWCWVRLDQGLEVWSVYNPPDTKEAPSRLLQLPPPTRPTVLAGDFNLHHPCWDLFERLDRRAEDLLDLAVRWDLELRTPFGATTWAPQGQRQGRPSTIDHIWASTGLRGSYYGIETRGRSDHYPQVLEVVGGTRAQDREAEQLVGWSWGLMDKKGVEAEARTLAVTMGLATGELERRARTVQGLQGAFDQLVAELQAIAGRTTPRRKPNRGFQAPWWNQEIQDLRGRAKRAERAYREVPTPETRAALNRASKALSAAIRHNKTARWRATLQEAHNNQALLWRLERWARLKSFAPVDPPKLPALQDPQGGPDLATFEAKARALAGRFFPSPPADLGDILDPELAQEWPGRFAVNQEVTPEEIAQALRRTAPWKAPGADLLPTGFLKACGEPLTRILAILTTGCLRLGWFPPRFKVAKTVVLQKPGKPPAAYRTPAGYRPIALLPTIGKVIEVVVARRVTEAAEANGLLPDEQMGNRANRSTELAIRLVVAQIQEAWRQRATASLLQLDISGAFDTVNHTRLLATLRDLGYPKWLVVWVRAWLTDRSAILWFDGEATDPIPVPAGVPQGSPLSPVLFLLYISTLYRVLKEEHPYLGLVGFADDTNLLAFGKTPEANARQLERAWETCLRWARTRGMAFAAEKSELIHFNKGRRQWDRPVNLALPQGGGVSPIQPTKSARFLGVWLDWRLSWAAHKGAVERKLKTQEFPSPGSLLRPGARDLPGLGSYTLSAYEVL